MASIADAKNISSWRFSACNWIAALLIVDMVSLGSLGVQAPTADWADIAREVADMVPVVAVATIKGYLAFRFALRMFLRSSRAWLLSGWTLRPFCLNHLIHKSLRVESSGKRGSVYRSG